MKTVGISPKAVLAFLLPAIGTLVLAVLDQVLTPDMDPSLKIAIVGLANAILAFAGAYAGSPGAVTDGRSSWGGEKPAPTHGTATEFVSTAITPRVSTAYVKNTDPAPVPEEPADPDALPDYETMTAPPPDEGDAHSRPETAS